MTFSTIFQHIIFQSNSSLLDGRIRQRMGSGVEMGDVGIQAELYILVSWSTWLYWLYIYAFQGTITGWEDQTEDRKGCGDGRHRDHGWIILTESLVNLTILILYVYTFQFTGWEDQTEDGRGYGDGRRRDHGCTILTGVLVNLTIMEVVKTVWLCRVLLADGRMLHVTTIFVIFVNRYDLETCNSPEKLYVWITVTSKT